MSTAYVGRNRSYSRNRRAAQRQLQRQFILLAAILVALIIIVGSASYNVLSCASQEHEVYKYYTSIQVQKGDTLWSIAEQYADASVSVQDYIAEVKTLNNIIDDDIHQGAYLTIPYYSVEVL